MKQVRVKRLELLERVRANREAHHELFLKAEAGYLYWIECAGLFLAVIQLGCEGHRQADSDFARIQTSPVQADCQSRASQAS